MKFGDRVQETTGTTGTGDITLAGPTDGHLSFAAEIGEGVLTPYLIEEGGEWEHAEGKLNGSILTRDTIKSSIGGPLNLSGNATVTCALPAAFLNIPRVAAVTQKPGEALPDRPDAEVVHWYCWDEPPVSAQFPYDQWFEIPELVAPQVPNAITDLSVTIGDESAMLSWTVPESDTPAEGVNLYRNTADDFASANEVVSGLSTNATTFLDTGLTNNQPYWWWAVAYNFLGNADPSNVVSGTPMEEPPAIPDAPTGLSASTGDGLVSLTWTPSTSTGDHAPDGHRVYRNTSDDFSGASQVGGDLGSSADSYTDGDVTNDTEYWYWVTAFNADGESEPSDGDSATPIEPSDVVYTDFSEYPTGDMPDDWHRAWSGGGTVEVIEDSISAGGNALKITGASGSNRRTYLYWDEAPDSADVEMLGEWSIDDRGDNSFNHCVLAVRANADTATETGYAIHCRYGTFRVVRFLSGNFQELASSPVSPEIQSGVKMMTRFRVIGSDLKAKIWDSESDEPTDWTIEVSDAEITGPGTSGVGVNGPFASTRYHRVSMAQDGGTAVFP